MENISDIVLVEKRNDVIYVDLKLKVNLDLQLAEAMIKKRLAISNGKHYPAILNGTNIAKIDPDASSYMDTKEASSLLTKVAVITPNLLNIIMFNSWMYTKKREVPIKLFKSLKEAEAWILSN